MVLTAEGSGTGFDHIVVIGVWDAVALWPIVMPSSADGRAQQPLLLQHAVRSSRGSEQHT